MRIRKNAKLSPLLFSSSSSSSQNGSVPVVTFQTHVCQLNQSPWDVIPFDCDSIQFEGEDSFTAGNGGGFLSAGDSIGADESVATMMDVEAKIEDVAMMDDNHKVAKNLCCQSFDGKRWPCKNEAKHGQSICNHHLSMLRSKNNNTPSTKKAAAVVFAAGTTTRRGGRARAGKKTTSSNSNPNEFYYYSGFGPLWGKKRGDRNGGEGSKINKAEENSTLAITTLSLTSDDDNAHGVQIDNNEEFDYVDNDEEEEDANDDSGKKRMRKPVKARSLKSLM